LLAERRQGGWRGREEDLEKEARKGNKEGRKEEKS